MMTRALRGARRPGADAPGRPGPGGPRRVSERRAQHAPVETERPRGATAPARVVLVVPAHDEEQGIEGALRSVERQTRVPDRLIVMCDNCSDGTAAVTERLGWEVWRSEGNRHK